MSDCAKNDEELVRKVRSGDRGVFSRIYHDNFSNLCDFVHRYVKNRSVCEELVQELFLSIWKRREGWKPKGTIRSYLYRGAKNRAFDYLKHLKVEKEYVAYLQSERESEQALNVIGLSEEEVLKQNLAKAIENAIVQLPERRRIIFLLSREDGLTYEEIADVLGISVKTVETQMGRSLKKLRMLLSDYLPGLIILTSVAQKINFI